MRIVKSVLITWCCCHSRFSDTPPDSVRLHWNPLSVMIISFVLSSLNLIKTTTQLRSIFLLFSALRRKYWTKEPHYLSLLMAVADIIRKNVNTSGFRPWNSSLPSVRLPSNLSINLNDTACSEQKLADLEISIISLFILLVEMFSFLKMSFYKMSRKGYCNQNAIIRLGCLARPCLWHNTVNKETWWIRIWKTGKQILCCPGIVSGSTLHTAD